MHLYSNDYNYDAYTISYSWTLTHDKYLSIHVKSFVNKLCLEKEQETHDGV